MSIWSSGSCRETAAELAGRPFPALHDAHRPFQYVTHHHRAVTPSRRQASARSQTHRQRPQSPAAAVTRKTPKAHPPLKSLKKTGDAKVKMN